MKNDILQTHRWKHLYLDVSKPNMVSSSGKNWQIIISYANKMNKCSQQIYIFGQKQSRHTRYH